MSEPSQTLGAITTPSIRHNSIIATVALTALVMISFIWNANNLDHQAIELAKEEARANWNKDQAFRQWATEHGGIYVKPDERTQPSPYMAHLPKRDLIATDGTKLTLMNPAYMMSQMTREFEKLFGVKGRITGRVFLNPENAPDEWELKALHKFEQGIQEVSEQSNIDGSPYIRLIRPMVMTKGCLLCHEHQGFAVGDIGGGVSVSIPLKRYIDAANKSKGAILISHGFVWFLGIGTIGLIATRAQRRVTLQQRAEQALRESESRFKNIFHTSEVSIWNEDLSGVQQYLEDLKSQGIENLRPYLKSNPDEANKIADMVKIIQVNDATLNLFETSEQHDLMGPISRTFGENAIDVFIDMLCAIWDDQQIFRAEANMRSLKGRKISVILSLRIPQSKEGFKNVPVSFVDITYRQQAEELLVDAKNEADKANQAKSEFLASMSHELRTPLNAVLGFAQMLQYDPKQPLTETQNENVGHILESGNHLLELVNEVLDLARIEANQFSLSLSEVDANEAVANCVALTQPLAHPTNITIVDKFSSSERSSIHSDPVRFKQILINLLSNAVKYNKDGGTVTIEGRELDTGFLYLGISDTGIGIPKTSQEGVFEMFHRIVANPHISREGTGIGLTVTKALVERMGGQIGFESEENVGSTFWVKLPLVSNQDILIWSRALQIGIKPIDDDHQVLISLTNQILHHENSSSEKERLIGELIDYTHYHFRREEAIMRVCGYPDFENHSRRHREIAKKITDLTDRWRADQSTTSLHDIQKFLRTLLLDDVMNADTKMAQYAKNKEWEIHKALEKLG